MEGITHADKYYSIIGKKAILERHALAIRQASQKLYLEVLKKIATEAGYDIKVLYADITAKVIDNLIEEGKIKI